MLTEEDTCRLAGITYKPKRRKRRPAAIRAKKNSTKRKARRNEVVLKKVKRSRVSHTKARLRHLLESLSGPRILRFGLRVTPSNPVDSLKLLVASKKRKRQTKMRRRPAAMRARKRQRK